MKTRFTLLCFCVLVLFNCTKDQAGPGECFQEQILPIFVSNCTMSGCHNAKDREGGYDLTTYEGIMKGITAKHPLRSEIYNQIRGSNPSMPPAPYPKLSSGNVNAIKLWINMGARNSSNCSSCDTTDFTYSGRIKPIIQQWCTGCHNSTNSSGSLDLSSYNGLVQAIPNNRLLGSIMHSPGFSPMPQNTAALSECDVAVIRKWVESGYPNN